MYEKDSAAETASDALLVVAADVADVAAAAVAAAVVAAAVAVA